MRGVDFNTRWTNRVAILTEYEGQALVMNLLREPLGTAVLGTGELTSLIRFAWDNPARFRNFSLEEERIKIANRQLKELGL